MTIDRRNFLKVSASGAALAAVASTPVLGACTSTASKGKIAEANKTRLKLSFQEGTAPGDNLHQKFDFMEELGVVGYEPGGFGLKDQVKEIQDALKGRNIQISAICAGFRGFILSTEESVRQECIDSMKEIIEAAGALQSVGVIIVPAFNAQKPVLPHTRETRDFLCEQFNILGDFAKQHNTTVILEPLMRGEAFYLRQIADAASICRDINNDGVRCMGDFWHMTHEETSDMGAILSGGAYLQHMHIASRKRRVMPGEDGDADNYVDGFKALKMINYDKFISYECGLAGEDRGATIRASVDLLREQWEKA
jgi:sugar phosphate isomerase/epimerase